MTKRWNITALLLITLLLTACATPPLPPPVLLRPDDLPRLAGVWTGTLTPQGGTSSLTDLIITTEGRFTTPSRTIGEAMGRLWIQDDGRIGFETGLSSGVFVLHEDLRMRRLRGHGIFKTSGRARDDLATAYHEAGQPRGGGGVLVPTA